MMPQAVAPDRVRVSNGEASMPQNKSQVKMFGPRTYLTYSRHNINCLAFRAFHVHNVAENTRKSGLGHRANKKEAII